MFLTPGSRASRFKLPFVHETAAPVVGNLAIRSGSIGQGLHLYENYVDDNNYVRAVIDWNTAAAGGGIPTFTIGAETKGSFSAAGAALAFDTGWTNYWLLYQGKFYTSNGTITVDGNAGYVWTTGVFSVGNDTNFGRIAAGVVGIADQVGNATDRNGYYQWGGQARVTSPVSVTSSITLADVTGLTVNVKAGRTYSFAVDVPYTCAAAGGIQLAMSGTATATNIVYDGYVIDSGSNGIKGNAQATALGTAVANTTTTGTAGHAVIRGTITVNAAGTLKVQMAQNTSNGTATVALQGAYMIVQDMP